MWYSISIYYIAPHLLKVKCILDIVRYCFSEKMYTDKVHETFLNDFFLYHLNQKSNDKKYVG